MRDAGFDGRIVLLGEETELPYERPPLSKEVLLDPIGSSPKWVLDPDTCARQAIELHLGRRVEQIEPGEHRLRCAGGEIFEYSRLLLATGARPRRLPFPQADSRCLFYLRTLSEARALAEKLTPGVRAVILGGGFIGLEVAAAAVKRGSTATVIELGPTLLGRFAPAAAAEYVAQVHRAHGVKILTSTRVTALTSPHACAAAAGATVLGLSDGSVLEADLVVVGVGVQPDTALAQAAGLQVDDGVLVNEEGRSSDPDIFAAGDVARAYHPLYGRHIRLECWQNAQDQGINVGRVMAGAPPQAPAVPWAWSDQFELNIQVAGLCRSDASVILRGRATDASFSLFNLQDEVIIGAMTLNAGGEMALIRRLIAGRCKVDPVALADKTRTLRSLIPKSSAPLSP